MSLSKHIHCHFQKTFIVFLAKLIHWTRNTFIGRSKTHSLVFGKIHSFKPQRIHCHFQNTFIGFLSKLIHWKRSTFSVFWQSSFIENAIRSFKKIPTLGHCSYPRNERVCWREQKMPPLQRKTYSAHEGIPIVLRKSKDLDEFQQNDSKIHFQQKLTLQFRKSCLRGRP